MQSLVRRMLVPVLAASAVTLGATAANAFVGQPKPEIKVEGERSPQGARLTFKGKNWAANARIKLTGTRAPGTNGTQDFGMAGADDKGVLTFRKTVLCSTSNADDAQRDAVTITAADSATGVKATTRVEGGAWLCQ